MLVAFLVSYTNVNITLNWDLSPDIVITLFQLNQQAPEEGGSPSQAEKQRLMAENLHGCDINSQRILAYQNKAPLPPEVSIFCRAHYNF